MCTSTGNNTRFGQICSVPQLWEGMNNVNIGNLCFPYHFKSAIDSRIDKWITTKNPNSLISNSCNGVLVLFVLFSKHSKKTSWLIHRSFYVSCMFRPIVTGEILLAFQRFWTSSILNSLKTQTLWPMIRDNMVVQNIWRLKFPHPCSYSKRFDTRVRWAGSIYPWL